MGWWHKSRLLYTKPSVSNADLSLSYAARAVAVTAGSTNKYPLKFSGDSHAYGQFLDQLESPLCGSYIVPDLAHFS
jgi:hypothetical protein